MGILPNCRDPSLNALKSKGYNVVQLPRVDLLPTQLLVNKNNRLQRLGELLSVFVADPAGPPARTIKADQPGPNISGTKSADLDIGFGLNLLGGMISALGGSTLGLNLAYNKASTIQFEFAGTLENSSELALIDQFLAGSRINPFARAIADMLESDRVYVVTSTLKASRINVSAKNALKQSIGIDLPVIQNAIGGSLKVASNATDNSVVTFEGSIPLVFGFQAVQLIFDDGRYQTMRVLPAGKVSAEAVGPASEPVFLDADTMLAGTA